LIIFLQNQEISEKVHRGNNQQERKNAAPPWSCGDSQCAAPSVSERRKGG